MTEPLVFVLIVDASLRIDQQRLPPIRTPARLPLQARDRSGPWERPNPRLPKSDYEVS